MTLKSLAMYGGLYLGTGLVTGMGIVGSLGTAVVLEITGGSIAAALGTVTIAASFLAVPVALIGGSVYILAKSQSWNRKEGMEKAFVRITDNLSKQTITILRQMTDAWEK